MADQRTYTLHEVADFRGEFHEIAGKLETVKLPSTAMWSRSPRNTTRPPTPQWSGHRCCSRSSLWPSSPKLNQLGQRLEGNIARRARDHFLHGRADDAGGLVVYRLLALLLMTRVAAMIVGDAGHLGDRELESMYLAIDAQFRFRPGSNSSEWWC